MTGAARGSAVLVVSLVVAVLGSGSGTGAPAAPSQPVGTPMELTAQTPVVSAGGTFALRLRLDGVPPDGSLRVIVHQRVRSRSELAQSMEGTGLRSEVLDTAMALSSLSAEADGTRRLALSLDPATGGLPLRTEGVYPVELIAQDTAGEPLGTLLTHLIMAPEEGDDAPPLGVAAVVELGAPPALRPDGTTRLDRAAVGEMAELVTGLLAAPDVPATLAATPETIDALSASAEPGDLELVGALRTAVAGRTLLAQNYVEVSPDDLAPAGLLGELTDQHDRGRQVLADALGATPTSSVGLSPPGLGADGLAVLAFSGMSRIVVADDQVAPLESGTISYSLAQPFLLSVPEGTPADAPAPTNVQALATDPVVLDRLATEGSPGLVASRVLSELALLRLEQPSIARSIVLPIEAGIPAGVVQILLGGLGAGRPFAPMGLDEAFAHAAPLLDRGGNQVDRRLLPSTARPPRATDARALSDARAHLSTFVGLVGDDSPQLESLSRHLLLATAAELSSGARRAHSDTVEAAIDDVTGSVSTPATFTLTLTAREGTVPLTIRNDAGLPLHVTVRLRSQKLDFPQGDTIDLLLTEEIQRVDIAVRSRASGAFPLEVDVTSPDGQRSLSVTRYTVRSTAVSGVGLVLSGGAGLFLIVWWARHWRRTRRSAKLVAAHSHPSGGGG